MIIFQKLLELFKIIFGFTLERPAVSLLFSFIIFFSLFLSLFLIFYWFYLEKREPTFRKKWQKRFQTAKEAKAGIEIKDVCEELKEILKYAKDKPYESFNDMLELLKEVFYLMGYEKNFEDVIEKISPLILKEKDKEKLKMLLEIRRKWFEKLENDKNFVFPEDYLRKIFQETLSLFKSLRFIAEEDFPAWLQELPL